MKKDSVGKNFAFQLIYQLVILLFPLIISPILTRTLGKEGLGVYTYANSIAYYFVIFANMGIAKYGQRLIASAEDEFEKRKRFWSLWSVHAVFSILSIVAYVLFCFVFIKDNRDIYLANTFFVASALFDITWLFYGLESFKGVVIRNLFLKIVTFFAIIIFVRSPDDLLLYTYIETIGLLLANCLLVPFAAKHLPFAPFTFRYCTQHFKPLSILFVSVLAATLYTVFDKTLIGLITADKGNVALYEYANKIVNIPKAIIAVICVVIFPKACSLIEKGDFDGLNKYVNLSFLVVSFIGFGSVFGLSAISNEFSVLFYGEDFSECGKIIMYLCPIVLFIGYGEILRNLFLVPKKKDTLYVLCIAVSAAINIFISIFLIAKIGVYGAVIGTVSAELIGLILQAIICRKDFSAIYLLKCLVVFSLCGAIMFACLLILNLWLPQGFKFLALKICVGLIVYTALSCFAIRYFFRGEFILFSHYLERILQRPFPFSSNAQAETKTERNGRDFAIDILRIVGILLVILAHTSINKDTSSIVFNLRNFDVVLLVFISGISAYKSGMVVTTWRQYFQYLKKRFMRLVLPCLLFIVLYYAYMLVMNRAYPNPHLNIKSFFMTITLIGGAGYVWIVRILFCVAVFAPFLKNMLISKPKWLFGIVLGFCLLINEVGAFFSADLSGYIGTLVNTILLPVFGYSFVYGVSMLVVKNRLWENVVLTAAFSSTALFLIFRYGFNLQAFKYPPHSLFLAYGISVSLILYLTTRYLVAFVESFGLGFRLVPLLSKLSFTIYFCHVFVLYPFEYGNVLLDYPAAQYLILVVVSTTMALLIHLFKRGLFKLIDRRKGLT